VQFISFERELQVECSALTSEILPYLLMYVTMGATGQRNDVFWP
jgi:hypothetical protein